MQREKGGRVRDWKSFITPTSHVCQAFLLQVNPELNEPFQILISCSIFEKKTNKFSASQLLERTHERMEGLTKLAVKVASCSS